VIHKEYCREEEGILTLIVNGLKSALSQLLLSSFHIGEALENSIEIPLHQKETAEPGIFHQKATEPHKEMKTVRTPSDQVSILKTFFPTEVYPTAPNVIEQFTPMEATQHAEVMDIFPPNSILTTPSVSAQNTQHSIQAQKPLTPTTQEMAEKTVQSTTTSYTELMTEKLDKLYATAYTTAAVIVGVICGLLALVMGLFIYIYARSKVR
jgi:sensor c-di-GMP phosphodiesterase-like protein